MGGHQAERHPHHQPGRPGVRSAAAGTGARVYATVAQYQTFTHDQVTPTDIVQAALEAATEVINVALIGAVYPTDADRRPTNPEHIDVIMRATCAQAQFEIANDDPAHVKQFYASTSMGGVTLTRTQRAQDSRSCRSHRGPRRSSAHQASWV
jgi:hypothetical protein